MKKNAGITLVALVITIIILLILAGVAISMITGGEGLFAQANGAATKYNQAAKNEADLINKLLNGNYLNGGGNEEKEDPEIRKDNKTINGSETGNAENPIIPQGFKPVNEGNANWGDGTTNPPGWNDGLVIQDKDGNQFVWVPVQVTISNEIQTKLNNGTALTVAEIQATWPRKAWATNKDTSTRETLDTTVYTEPYSLGTGYANENADYIEMGTSVLKNGGFYVGRYEGGTETPRTAKTDPTNTLVCKAHVYPYNFIAWGKSMPDTSKPDDCGSKGAVELCREMYTGKNGYSIKSSLIYGVQWDSIIEWIENERNVSNSTEWGNYYNRAYTIKAGTEFAYLSQETYELSDWQIAATDIEKTTSDGYLLKTGEYAETATEGTTNTNGAVKNIYDLAGNCHEWTMEACDTNYRVARGGGYGNYGGGPASDRYYGCNPYGTNGNGGARVALYL